VTADPAEVNPTAFETNNYDFNIRSFRSNSSRRPATGSTIRPGYAKAWRTAEPVTDFSSSRAQATSVSGSALDVALAVTASISAGWS